MEKENEYFENGEVTEDFVDYVKFLENEVSFPRCNISLEEAGICLANIGTPEGTIDNILTTIIVRTGWGKKKGFLGKWRNLKDKEINEILQNYRKKREKM